MLPPSHPADYVGQHVPRLLINREKAGELTAVKRSLGYTRGFDWSPETNYRSARRGACLLRRACNDALPLPQAQQAAAVPLARQG